MRHERRADLQGLRALAVALVVAFHLWPGRVPGGFVGVDVFFVISGYLITAHLAREAHATGTVRVGAFWARRIRRLLPAAVLVIVASALAAYVWIPATEWAFTARHLTASSLYIENWALARDAVDYGAMSDAPTVAQHFWSLSVEEQFYLVWPLIVVGALWWAARARRLGGRAAMAWGIGALSAASLAFSIAWSGQHASAAYFVTPTRVWEFGAGALLALTLREGAVRRPWRAVVPWIGLAAIAASALLLNATEAFPGWRALVPVLGAVAVVAGSPPSRLSAAPLLSWRPAVFVGDISYAIYLWHWPLIILWPHITGRSRALTDSFVIVALTVTLAWLTKVTIEDRARQQRWLIARPARTFAFGAASMIVAVIAAQSLPVVLDHRVTTAQVAARAVTSSACYGPAIVDAGPECGPMQGSGPISPTAEDIVANTTGSRFSECQASFTTREVVSCDLGAPKAKVTLAIVGDSHATQWLGALDAAGKTHGWHIVTYTKSACPLTDAHTTFPREKNDGGAAACEAWRTQVVNTLVARRDISAVIVASFSSIYSYATPAGADWSNPATEGYTSVWRRLMAKGISVIAIDDVPRTQGESIPTCVTTHLDDVKACGQPRSMALSHQPLVDAAAAMTDPLFTAVDLRRFICDAQWCYPVVGNLIVYRDYSHLSVQFAAALAKPLGAGIADALALRPAD